MCTLPVVECAHRARSRSSRAARRVRGGAVSLPMRILAPVGVRQRSQNVRRVPQRVVVATAHRRQHTGWTRHHRDPRSSMLMSRATVSSRASAHGSRRSSRDGQNLSFVPLRPERVVFNRWRPNATHAQTCPNLRSASDRVPAGSESHIAHGRRALRRCRPDTAR
jgi:hypothetical protein